MVEANSVNLIAVGGLGQGKSSLLNTLVGDGQAFATSASPLGCTKSANSKGLEWNGKEILLTDTPGLYDLRMPMPVWLAKYGQMEEEQKCVNKVLWVIRGVLRPNDECKLTRDIIRDMFQSDADFARHTTVVFTFADQDGIDNPQAWLAELCQDLPVPKYVFYAEPTATQDDMFNAILSHS